MILYDVVLIKYTIYRGETFECLVNSYDDNNESVKLIYKVKLNEIYKGVVPELSIDFFKRYGCNSQEEFDMYISNEIKNEKILEKEESDKKLIMYTIINNSSFCLDESEICSISENIKHKYYLNAKLLGLPLEVFIINYLDIQYDDFNEYCNYEAVYNIKKELVLREIYMNEFSNGYMNNETEVINYIYNNAVNNI